MHAPIGGDLAAFLAFAAVARRCLRASWLACGRPVSVVTRPGSLVGAAQMKFTVGLALHLQLAAEVEILVRRIARMATGSRSVQDLETTHDPWME